MVASPLFEEWNRFLASPLTNSMLNNLISNQARWDLIVQQERLSDGSRRIMSLTEVTGMEGPVITSQDIFIFEQRTIDEHGKVRGAFRATGIRPRFSAKLASNGIRLSPELFRFEMEV